MSAGRVVIVNTPESPYVLGALLKTSTVGANNEKVFTILTICDKNSNKDDEIDIGAKNSSNTGSAINSNSKAKNSDQSCDSELVTPVQKMSLFQPEGPCWHQVVTCKASDVAVVTTKTIKVDADKIINDVKKREQPRFRYEKGFSRNVIIKYAISSKQDSISLP